MGRDGEGRDHSDSGGPPVGDGSNIKGARRQRIKDGHMSKGGRGGRWEQYQGKVTREVGIRGVRPQEGAREARGCKQG